MKATNLQHKAVQHNMEAFNHVSSPRGGVGERGGGGSSSSLHVSGQDCYVPQTDLFLWLFYFKATRRPEKKVGVRRAFSLSVFS